jgi:hypothetical protein
MGVVAEDVRRDLYTLPANERVALANEVLSEFDDSREFEASWSGEVRSRIDDILNGKVQMIPASIVFAEARERAAARWA